MNLGDLLDELRHNILHDRSDQIAGDSDQLWSDQTLVRYINEAQRRMAREALLIRDSTTPDATLIKTVANQNLYPMHESVFAVLSARCQGDTADLARAGHASLDTYRIPDTYFFDPSSLSAMPPGKTLAFTTDEGVLPTEDGTTSGMIFRIYPLPDALHAVPINIRVVRYPLYLLQNSSDVPEIPTDHHMDMLDWAAYLALRVVDLDEGAPDRAKEFRQSFEAHVAEAKNIVLKKLFAPTPWGFGRNGWSWELN